MEITQSLNDPIKNFHRLHSAASARKQGSFLLCLASSKVSDLPDISAAGADAEARRLTPALDAEYLYCGRTLSAESLPVSPRGIVSPVVISRACLGLLGIPVDIIDCGSFQSPLVQCQRLANLVAESPSSGRALPLNHVHQLFQDGLKIGKKLSSYNQYLILAECVPGGTTTALALLSALAYECDGYLSSSLPAANHDRRRLLVKEGLENAPYSLRQMQEEPLFAVASVGDPMQAVLSGIAIAASGKVPVYLAGGSQMLAVWALIRALSSGQNLKADYRKISLVTTKWVAFDQSARVQNLAQMLAAPLVAACPDFSLSKHEGFRAYEEGNVKEGVGAGASLSFADMAGFSQQDIMGAIDESYDLLMELQSLSQGSKANH